MAKLKKFVANKHFGKGTELQGPSWLKSWVKLKKFESLMVNQGLNCLNPRPMTKMKKGIETQG